MFARTQCSLRYGSLNLISSSNARSQCQRTFHKRYLTKKLAFEKVVANPCLQSQHSCPGKQLNYLVTNPHTCQKRTKTTYTISPGELLKPARKPFVLYERGPEWETPLGKTVRTAQAQYPDSVVLTRVGGFWELYFEQAAEVAPLLDIKLTRRKFGSQYFPFAGFRLSLIDRHLETLVNKLGRSVVICEEVPNENEEDRLKFNRVVSRIITPGTLIDESFLEHNTNNFLLVVAFDEEKDSVGLAWVDISTGDFFVQNSNIESLSSDLARIRPREILLSDVCKLVDTHPLWRHIDKNQYFITYVPWNFFDVGTDAPDLTEYTKIELGATTALKKYVENNLMGREVKFNPPMRINAHETMIIDETALNSLEITTSMREKNRKGSLLDAIDRTRTMSGARNLTRWLCHPSTSTSIINTRLDLVEYFYKNTHLLSDIRELLGECDDAQRVCQRLSLQRGGADDLIKFRRTADAMIRVKARIKADPGSVENASVQAFLERLKPQHDLIKVISKAIDEDALNRLKEYQEKAEDEIDSELNMEEVDNANNEPEVPAKSRKKATPRKKVKSSLAVYDELDTLLAADNWVIKKDASPRMTQMHKQLESLYRQKIELQKKWRADYKSTTLELRSNPKYGFIVVIRRTTGSDLPNDAILIKQQGKINWYIAPQWTALGGKIETLKASIKQEETLIYAEIRAKVLDKWLETLQNCFILDELDVASSLALVAKEQGFVRPVLNNGTSHRIVGGRHPIVEGGLRSKGRQFYQNDCHVGEQERLWVITGPNMGGKSTFLRQNAIISILAQIGSFVPADYAEIGIVDKVFSRVGGSDSIYQDQSTFMVEMMETAHILRHATHRSFVIMDEVGRGTTALDGIAISFATLYHLYYNNRCRTLFATHFHELADMIKHFECAGCYCTDLKEDKDGSFQFLHKVRRGVNWTSAALKVAKSADMPQLVLNTAEQIRSYLKENVKPFTLEESFRNSFGDI